MFDNIRKKAESELAEKREKLGVSKTTENKSNENATPRGQKYIRFNTEKTSEYEQVDKKLANRGAELTSTSMNEKNSSGVEQSWENFCNTFDVSLRVIQKTNTFISASKNNPTLKSVSESQQGEVLMSHLTAFYEHINAEFVKKNGVDMLTVFIATGGVKPTEKELKSLKKSISGM